MQKIHVVGLVYKLGPVSTALLLPTGMRHLAVAYDIETKYFFTEYDDKTQPKLTLPNQNYGRNVPKPYS